MERIRLHGPFPGYVLDTPLRVK